MAVADLVGSRGGKLLARQQAFAEEFVRCGNKTKAALLAGYSPKTAAQYATQLTDPDTSPLVCEYIERLRERRRLALVGTEQRIEEELARIAYLDVEQLYDDEGKPRPLSEMTEDARRAIVALKTVSRETLDEEGNEVASTKLVDLVMASKLQALKQLADLKGIGRGTGASFNNFNAANASAEAVAALDWGSLREGVSSQEDAVAARLEAARSEAEAKEQEAEAGPSLNGHSTNGKR